MPTYFPENNDPAPGDTIERSLQKINDLVLAGGGGGGSGAPTNATYITQTANATLTNEQALSALATGLVKNTTGTGVLSIGAAGTDYAAASHVHAAADITSGTIATARLGSGVADATTFLRGDQTWAVPAGGGGDALTTNPLSQFAATTSAQLAGVISDETGSGLLVFQTSPTLVTPILGVATGTRLGLGAAADATASLVTIGQILSAAGTAAAPAFAISGDPNTGVYSTTADQLYFGAGGTAVMKIVAGGSLGLYQASGGSYNWNPTTIDSSADLRLFRDAAGTLAQRNGTSAQRLRVYNTFTTVETSGEWFSVDWTSTANVCKLWTVKGSGAGTGRDLLLGADSTELLRFQTGSKIGFFGVTPVVRASAYTPTNVTTDRAYDADTAVAAELADVLGTLIADLQAYGILQ